MKAKLRKATINDDATGVTPVRLHDETGAEKVKTLTLPRLIGLLRQQTRSKLLLGLFLLFLLFLLLLFSGPIQTDESGLATVSAEEDLQKKPKKAKYMPVATEKPKRRWKLKDGSHDTLLEALEPNIFGYSSLNDKRKRKMEQNIQKRRSQFDMSFANPKHFFSEFRDFETLVAYYQWFAEKHTKRVSFGSIGESFEGRPILGLRLSKSVQPNKLPNLVIIGTEHGREWTVPNALSYAMSTIMGDKSSTVTADIDSSRILEYANIWLIPVLNPDGYSYTFRGDASSSSEASQQMRFWRKNRQTNEDKTIGIDLNRNWGSEGFTWGHGQTWTDSEVYMGTAPFSAVETKAFRKWIFDPAVQDGRPIPVSGFIAVHCCIGGVLQPRNFCTIPSAIENSHEALGRAMVRQMNSVGHGKYNFQRRRKVQEISSSGISIDWAYYDAKIPYPLMIETSVSTEKKNMDKPERDPSVSVAKARKERLRAKMASDEGSDVPEIGNELEKAILLHAAFIGGLIRFEDQHAEDEDEKFKSAIKASPWGFKGEMFKCKQNGKPDLIPADFCAQNSSKPWIKCKGKKKGGKKKRK